MKKFFSIALALVLLLPMLAGCQSALRAAQAPSNSPALMINSSQKPTDLTPSEPPAGENKRLNTDEALEIALQDAGLSRDEIRDPDVDLDTDDGTVHYDVEFEADGYDYDYEIDAASGKILKSRKEKD